MVEPSRLLTDLLSHGFDKDILSQINAYTLETLREDYRVLQARIKEMEGERERLKKAPEAERQMVPHLGDMEVELQSLKGAMRWIEKVAEVVQVDTEVVEKREHRQGKAGI
ncbi:MAG: hypothetical protein Q9167_003508 [Letrouitia subvulpina]